MSPIYLLVLLPMATLGQRVCSTVPTSGGTATSEKCVLPFRLDGNEFAECTAVGDPDNKLWCSVEVDENGEHVGKKGRWGHCDPDLCGTNNNNIAQESNNNNENRKTEEREDEPRCITISGPDEGAACVFPFKFGGRVYTECTRDGDPDQQLWCSTKTNENDEHQRGFYGKCRCREKLGNCGGSLSGLKFIVGGENASLEEFPFVALLGFRLGTRIVYGCGGSLLNRRYVLTAGHCVTPNVPVEVVLGELNIDTDCDCEGNRCAPKAQHIGVAEVILHENYERGPNSVLNDIALLRLNQAALLNSAVHMTCLPLNPSLSAQILEWDSLEKGEKQGRHVTVIGWGRTVYDSSGEFRTKGVSSPHLQKVNLTMIEVSRCQSDWQNALDVDLHMCAGDLGKDSCKGDSGGPMFATEPLGSTIQLGLVSFGRNRCGNGVPGVYTRIQAYVPWIKEHIRP